MKKAGKTGDTEPKKPDKPALPTKHENGPEPEEEGRAHYYSPPCMMGELDEIMDDEAVRRDRC